MPYDTKEKQKAWVKANPDKLFLAKLNKREKRLYNAWAKYGISKEQYLALEAERNGMCDCCGKTPEPDSYHGGLCVDHNHSTGEIRALVCGPCNTRIACAESAKFVSYLNRRGRQYG